DGEHDAPQREERQGVIGDRLLAARPTLEVETTGKPAQAGALRFVVRESDENHDFHSTLRAPRTTRLGAHRSLFVARRFRAQLRVIVSCRLRITRAAEVQAASSGGAMFSGIGFWPTCRSSFAAFSSARYSSRCF